MLVVEELRKVVNALTLLSEVISMYTKVTVFAQQEISNRRKGRPSTAQNQQPPLAHWSHFGWNRKFIPTRFWGLVSNTFSDWSLLKSVSILHVQ